METNWKQAYVRLTLDINNVWGKAIDIADTMLDNGNAQHARMVIGLINELKRIEDIALMELQTDND